MLHRLLERRRLSVTRQQQLLLQVPCSELGQSGLPKHVVDVAEPERRVVIVVVVQLLADSNTWWRGELDVLVRLWAR
jgi:hypothetical protein